MTDERLSEIAELCKKDMPDKLTTQYVAGLRSGIKRLLKDNERLRAELAAAPCFCVDCEYYRIDGFSGGICTNKGSSYSGMHMPPRSGCQHCERRKAHDSKRTD